MKKVTIHEVMLCFAYQTPEGMREKPLVYPTTSTLESILKEVKEFACEKEYDLDNHYGRDHTVVCIKIWSKEISGMGKDRRSLTLFEWKDDYPGSFENWAAKAISSQRIYRRKVRQEKRLKQLQQKV